LALLNPTESLNLFYSFQVAIEGDNNQEPVRDSSDMSIRWGSGAIAFCAFFYSPLNIEQNCCIDLNWGEAIAFDTASVSRI
jgi:hypothetical protein